MIQGQDITDTPENGIKSVFNNKIEVLLYFIDYFLCGIIPLKIYLWDNSPLGDQFLFG